MIWEVIKKQLKWVGAILIELIRAKLFFRRSTFKHILCKKLFYWNESITPAFYFILFSFYAPYIGLTFYQWLFYFARTAVFTPYGLFAPNLAWLNIWHFLSKKSLDWLIHHKDCTLAISKFTLYKYSNVIK